MNLETQTGKGALNSTHLVAFQEESQNSVARNNKFFLPRTKRRSLERIAQDPIEIIADPKREPPSISNTLTVDGGLEICRYVSNYMLWIVIRKLNTLDQIVSTFAGWNTHVKKTKLTSPLKKTVMTYLPPINSKVTEFDTIYRYFEYQQQLAAEANMPYVNITLDVGAAMSAFKLLWNYPEKFGNVIIHLGDFHFIKENFSLIGKPIVDGSGFEDAIFQTEVCSSGSLNGVLSGSHYNRCWTVHSAFAEALERLLLERFLTECDVSIPETFAQIAQEPDSATIDDVCVTFIRKYDEFKQSVHGGKLGKTPQFWLVLYLDLMRTQNWAHLAVHDNNLDLRYYCYKFFLPLYLALHKTNYARYASYYVKMLENRKCYTQDSKIACLRQGCLYRHKNVFHSESRLFEEASRL